MTDPNITEYFEDVCLADAVVPGYDNPCILHTKTNQYVVGKLGIETTVILQFEVPVTFHRDDFSSPDEYRQRVLEEFEDWVKILDADGFCVDYSVELM